MTPVIPCSVSNILLFPGTVCAARKNCSTRSSLIGKPSKHTLSLERFVLPSPASVCLFSQYRRGCALHYKLHILSAAGTDVAVGEPESPVADEKSTGASEIPSNAETSEESSMKSDARSSPAKVGRVRNVRKSEMPPIKDEDLIPGATFTGKVRSIQAFGAFVDIGAFAEGLVHKSRLSDSFVQDVGAFVSIGQEVKVRVVEVNTETRRISLSMREGDDNTEPQKQREAPGSSGKPRPARKSNQMKTSKFSLGENLEGVVKNVTRAGAFISLPGEEEGFLPQSEEDREGFDSIAGDTSLVAGQEVSVTVLRINRGQVTLTMEKEVDTESGGELDEEVVIGEVHVATNPFLLAFRKNKEIAMFLDEREKLEKAATEPKISEEMEKVDQNETPSDTTEAVDQPAISDEGTASILSVVDETTKDEEASAKEADVDIAKNDDNPENIASIPSPTVDGAAEPKISEEMEKVDQNETLSDTTEAVDQPAISDEGMASVLSAVDETTKDEEASSKEADVDIAKNDDNPESTASSPAPTVDGAGAVLAIEKEEEAPKAENEIPANAAVEEERASLPGKNGSITSSDGQPDVLVPQEAKVAISPALVKQLREETGAGMMDCKNALSETGGDIAKAQEFLRKKGLASADKKAGRATAEGRIGSYIHDGRIGVLVEVNCETDFVSRGDIFKELVDDLAMQVAACPQVQYVVPEDIPEEIVNKEKDIEMQKEDLLSKPVQIRSRIVEGRIRKRLEELALLEQPYIKSDKVVVKDWVKQTIATVGENMKVKRFVRFNLGEGLEKKSQDFAAEVAAQTATKPAPTPEKEQPAPVEAKEDVEKPPAVAVSAALVKQLREETGAGMMDCKKALSETGGDLEKAQEFLRKKGLSTADKKSSRLAAEGRIGSYIHDYRIGVLIEVNCETDFVGRSEKFKELVDDLAMQVVACPQVQYVSIEDIPESMVQKEKELEMQRDDLLSKPENIREKIVEGRISKRLGEISLLEQPFIKDDSILVKDLVKQTVAAIGENIKVRRFVRFTLGETN